MRDSSTALSLETQSSSLVSLEVAYIKDRKVGVSQLSQNVSPDALPSCNITLILGNSRISEKSLGNCAVFIVPWEQETLNWTNNLFK